MNVNDLNLFAEVARTGSFAAVAKARNIDPSSVSRAIAGLEASLGVRLFQRTTRRMSLTEEGEVYLSRAVPLAEELSALRAETRQGREHPTGTLRLTASVTFGQNAIVPMMPEFRRTYPDISLDCIFTDANVDLVAERIDLAVRLAPAVEGDVIVTKLADTRYRVVASPGYIETHGRPTAPQGLTDHDCILFNLRDWRSRWRFRDRRGKTDDVPVQGRLVLSPAGALRDAAIAGLGPALLADWLIGADLANGDLVDLFPDFDVTATSFNTAAWIVYPSRSYLPAKVRAMIDFMKDRFQNTSWLTESKS
ncbi:MAG: LysR family transcriptional regulator [Pseudomonadota bacterium]